MAMSAADRAIAARKLGLGMFSVGSTANLNVDDLVAAIGAIDDTMDRNPPQLVANQSVKLNLINSLPEPFKTNSTAAQKALALVLWAQKEAGVI